MTEEILAEGSLEHIYRRCRYGGFIYRVPERQVELYKDEEEELVSIIVRAYTDEDPEEIVFITEPQEAQVSQRHSHIKERAMSDTGIDNQVFITDDDGNFISTKDMSVWTRVKMWEKRNDTAIKAFGLGAMFGLGVGLGIGLRQVQVVANIKSPGAVATGVQQLARRGHPGNVIKCVETGEVFVSQNRAAAAYGISAKALRNSLRGLKETAGGYHFEFVGEMPAPAGTVIAS